MVIGESSSFIVLVRILCGRIFTYGDGYGEAVAWRDVVAVEAVEAWCSAVLLAEW